MYRILVKVTQYLIGRSTVTSNLFKIPCLIIIWQKLWQCYKTESGRWKGSLVTSSFCFCNFQFLGVPLNLRSIFCIAATMLSLCSNLRSTYHLFNKMSKQWQSQPHTHALFKCLMYIWLLYMSVCSWKSRSRLTPKGTSENCIVLFCNLSSYKSYLHINSILVAWHHDYEPHKHIKQNVNSPFY